MGCPPEGAQCPGRGEEAAALPGPSARPLPPPAWLIWWRREDSRITTAALTCINTFLLHNGRDVFHTCAHGLHAVLHPLVLRLLRSGRDPKLREAAVSYLRILLQLGALQLRPSWLADVKEWLQREVGQAGGYRWGEDGRQGRLVVGRQQHALLELAAGVWFHSSSCAAAGGLPVQLGQGGRGQGEADGDRQEEEEEGEGEERLLPAAKRRRTAGLLATLLESALSQPVAWAPVGTQLLLSYGLALPSGVYAEWLQALSQRAPCLFAVHSPSSKEYDPDATLWALRFAHALATGWPTQLAGGGGGAGGGEEGGAQLRPERLREQWRVRWREEATWGGGGCGGRGRALWAVACEVAGGGPLWAVWHRGCWEGGGPALASRCQPLPAPLADCWPVLVASNGSSMISCIGSSMQAVWDAVLALARSPGLPPPAFAAALAALEAITRRGLAQLPPGFHRLWDLPVLGQSPTPAALEFVAAAVQSGSGAAAAEGTAWQEELLGWLKSAGSAAAASGAATAAFASVLCLPPPQQRHTSGGGGGSGSGSGSRGGQQASAAPSLGVLPLQAADAQGQWAQQPSWQWWQQDAEFDSQLAALLRGPLFMRAKALMASAAASAAPAGAQAAGPGRGWGAGGGGPTPPELHELAASSLADLLEEVLRQPPSPSPAVHHSSAWHPSRLAQLLGACTAAVAVTNRVVLAVASAPRPRPPSAAGVGGGVGP